MWIKYEWRWVDSWPRNTAERQAWHPFGSRAYSVDNEKSAKNCTLTLSLEGTPKWNGMSGCCSNQATKKKRRSRPRKREKWWVWAYLHVQVNVALKVSCRWARKISGLVEVRWWQKTRRHQHMIYRAQTRFLLGHVWWCTAFASAITVATCILLVSRPCRLYSLLSNLSLWLKYLSSSSIQSRRIRMDMTFIESRARWPIS